MERMAMREETIARAPFVDSKSEKYHVSMLQ